MRPADRSRFNGLFVFLFGAEIGPVEDREQLLEISSARDGKSMMKNSPKGDQIML